MRVPFALLAAVRGLAGWAWLLALAPALTGADADLPAVRRIEVMAHRYAFEPAVIEVTKGETVEIVAHSTDTEHGLAIKALGVKLVIPKGGATVSATFVARQAGRFPIECSEYCGSGHKRMKGELIVTEAGR
ncbi:MAG: cupredoxin domain-containing protein [Betaproteobacteria bacterium]